MNKKILFFVAVSSYFFSHRVSLARVLKEAGYDVCVACYFDSEAHKALLDEYDIKSIAVPYRSNKIAPRSDTKLAKFYSNCIKQYQPDMIIPVSIRLVFLALLVTLFNRRIKVLGMITGLGFLGVSKQIKSRLIKSSVFIVMKLAALKNNVQLIVQNKDDYQVVKKIVNNDRLHILYGSGVDTNKYSVKQDWNPQKAVVTMVSRLLIDKGVADYIAAAKLVMQQKPHGIQIKFQLVGTIDKGNPSSFSEKDVKKWVEEGYIDYLGYRSDIPEVYQASDIAVLPSRYGEGLPKSLLEAAATGLPLITCRAPGCNEICQHQSNGFLVPIKHPQQLAEAIINLAMNLDLRIGMGQQSRRLVEQRFSMNVINDDMIKIINNMFKG